MPMRTMHRVNGLMLQDLLRYEKKAREMTKLEHGIGWTKIFWLDSDRPTERDKAKLEEALAAPLTPAASEKPGFNAIKREQEICTLEAEVLRLREQLEKLQYGIAAVSFAMGWTDVCGKTNEEFARDLRRERDLAVSQVERLNRLISEVPALVPDGSPIHPDPVLRDYFDALKAWIAERDGLSNPSTVGEPK